MGSRGLINAQQLFLETLSMSPSLSIPHKAGNHSRNQRLVENSPGLPISSPAFFPFNSPNSALFMQICFLLLTLQLPEAPYLIVHLGGLALKNRHFSLHSLSSDT